MSSNQANLMKKIESVKHGPAQTKQPVNAENINFQGKISQDLDSRLDRLQNLLNKAKK